MGAAAAHDRLKERDRPVSVFGCGAASMGLGRVGIAGSMREMNESVRQEKYLPTYIDIQNYR